MGNSSLEHDVRGEALGVGKRQPTVGQRGFGSPKKTTLQRVCCSNTNTDLIRCLLILPTFFKATTIAKMLTFKYAYGHDQGHYENHFQK